MRGFSSALAVVFCALAFAGSPVAAQETGRGVATGSDSLTLNGRPLRLFGIDGFELHQNCFVEGQQLACGASAVRALQTLLDPGAVTCTPKGTPSAGERVAVCTGFDGDIAAKMVEQGWAIADRAVSEDYVAPEEAARANQAGAWRGTFLNPADYRGVIVATEAAYARQAAEATRAEVEAAITAGTVDLHGLETELSLATAGQFEDHEQRFDLLQPGYVAAAVQPPAVFTWTAIAGVLETTRQDGLAAINDSIAETVFAGLVQRPSETLDTPDERAFYAALKEAAAPLIADRRQPVLFVMAQDLPAWIRPWFSGNPPAGAEVTRRDDRPSSSYLGTIDGIDVYIGPGSGRAALLVPSDILAGLTFRANAEGRALALEMDGNTWIVRYGVALEWREDSLTWLAFPQQASPTPDAV